MVTIALKCRHCGSENLVRDGFTPNGKQRYWCHDCNRSSRDNPQPRGYTEAEKEQILAAYEAGCRRFDSALTGLGGCPFAGDNLVGNIATEDVLSALRKAGADPGIDSARLTKALEMTNEIRAKYAHAPLVN